jgi:alpha-L-arabinofuranosidase
LARDTKTKRGILKIVNVVGAPQKIRVEITGFTGIAPEGRSLELSADSRDDTNTISDPTRIAPVAKTINGLGPNFERVFPPYSITVLVLNGK